MIRVLIAEPYKFTRECLRALLDREQDILVLGEADGFDKAVSLARQLRPDVVLLDVDPHHSKGMESLRRIVGVSPKPAVVVLAAVDDPAMRVEYIKAGVKGYYSWRDPLAEILAAIRAVHTGRTYLSHQASISIPAPHSSAGE